MTQAQEEQSPDDDRHATSKTKQSRAAGADGVGGVVLGGCASQPDVAAICTDPHTHQRVEDDKCDDSDHPPDYNGTGSGFFWYYLGTHSGRVPAVGARYAPGSGTYNGSTYASSGKSVQRGGIPDKGVSSFKSFSKSGGFGSSRGVSAS